MDRKNNEKNDNTVTLLYLYEKKSLNKAYVIHHISQSLNDSSVAHVRIKTIKHSLPKENEHS